MNAVIALALGKATRLGPDCSTVVGALLWATAACCCVTAATVVLSMTVFMLTGLLAALMAAASVGGLMLSVALAGAACAAGAVSAGMASLMVCSYAAKLGINLSLHILQLVAPSVHAWLIQFIQDLNMPHVNPAALIDSLLGRTLLPAAKQATMLTAPPILGDETASNNPPAIRPCTITTSCSPTNHASLAADVKHQASPTRPIRSNTATSWTGSPASAKPTASLTSSQSSGALGSLKPATSQPPSQSPQASPPSRLEDHVVRGVVSQRVASYSASAGQEGAGQAKSVQERELGIVPAGTCAPSPDTPPGTPGYTPVVAPHNCTEAKA